MSLRAWKPAHTKPQFMTIKCDQFKGWADGLMCNKKPFVVPPRYQLDDAYYVASEMINEPDFEAFTQNACRYEAPSSERGSKSFSIRNTQTSFILCADGKR